MTNSDSIFEQNMIRVGNSVISKFISRVNDYKKYGESVIIVDLDEYFTEKNLDLYSDVTKGITTQFNFGENYDKIEETGSTFYFKSTVRYKILKGTKIPGNTESDYLEVDYARQSDYLNTLNEIINTSKYIETKESSDGIYSSYYSYGKYNFIVTKSPERGRGGTIKFSFKY